MTISSSPWGQSDIWDIIPLNRELNEKMTEVSDIINYHAAPVTIITGAKASQLERGPKKVWAGLPKDSQVFNLEFLPVAVERFDLVIPVEYFESALLAPLLALLRRRDPGFCSHVAALGGYNTWPMGQLLAEV